MKVALVCIAKNEDPYIEEWVSYHLKLGFDHVFIYENNWRCSFSHPKLTKIPFDGDVMQVKSYNNFIKHRSNEYDWAAFFDVDEFLVLKKHQDLKSFISDYTDFNGIGVNWCYFGNNGHEKINGNYSVLERFTKRKKDFDQHIKTILKLNKSFRMDVHCSNVDLIGTNKVPFNGPFHVNGGIEVAQLNHYFTKSKEEFKLKAQRGRADTGTVRPLSDFDSHNFNEIEDLLALNFMKK
jgi:hypothetical protein